MNRNIIIASVISASLLSTACIPVAIVGGAGLLGYGAAQERGIKGGLSDAAIETELNTLFITSKYKELFTNVSVDSVEGRVLLAGNVPTREARVQAENLTWSLGGVKEVINQIKVVDRFQFKAKDAAKDSWISTQVESRLVFSKNVASINYSIETVDGVVYLMGIAKNKQELETVAKVASQVPGVKKVVSYVRLKGEPVNTKASTPIDYKGSDQEVTGYSVDEVPENNSSQELIIEDISKDYQPSGSGSGWVKPNEVIDDEAPTLPGSIKMQDR